ncbi:hypothetical protein [Streptomyces sp. NPDC059176]
MSSKWWVHGHSGASHGAARTDARERAPLRSARGMHGSPVARGTGPVQ